MKKEFDADFYASVTRPAAVYRGNRFVVEAGIAYGGKLLGSSWRNDRTEGRNRTKFAAPTAGRHAGGRKKHGPLNCAVGLDRALK